VRFGQKVMTCPAITLIMTSTLEDDRGKHCFEADFTLANYHDALVMVVCHCTGSLCLIRKGSAGARLLYALARLKLQLILRLAT
jgi:hypothetical protein